VAKINIYIMKKYYLLSVFTLTTTLYSFSQCGDCPAQCVAADFSATACDGTTDEIGGTNQGFQSANEATSSYWYSICFSSNGTFAFTMNPGGNRNDFDFAVYSGTTCPPTTAPIRCSFAAVAAGGPCETCDYTGLGNGATDTSEDATGDGYVSALSVSNGQCITLVVHNYGSGSDDFAMDFTGTATITCVGVPLGIGFESFKGVSKEGYNHLSWVMDNTITNNDKFIVLKSKDMYEWNKIAEVDATSAVKYTYNDVETSNEVFYYKIEGVDANNNHRVTKSIAISGANKIKLVCTKIYDVFGKEYSEGNLPTGIVIYIKEYEDGSVEVLKGMN